MLEHTPNHGAPPLSDADSHDHNTVTAEHAEMCAMLSRLCKGDTSMRLAPASPCGALGAMKDLINSLADQMQAMIDNSHEMAIGLSEHYDALNRVIAGEYHARAPEDSPNELIAKLGELINRETVTLTSSINQLEETRNALVFQNILFSAQQEASIDGILLVDQNAKILSFNRRFTEIMAIPSHLLETMEDEPVLKHVAGRIADPERFLARVKYLYEHRQESSRDEIALHDGKTLDRYTVPLLDADGGYYGRLWSFRDITSRKAAEEETKNTYQQLFDIVEFLPDATFVVDRDKRVIAWNLAIEQLTGIEKRDMVGKGDYAYAIPFYGNNRPLLIDLLDQEQERRRHNYLHIKQEGHTLFTEVCVPSFRNGDDRYFFATATPLFDKHGNQTGAIESIRDITEYKEAQDDRLRMKSQLHHARMMENFMIRLGHDLRTPLTPLIALLPLIKERVADPKLQRMVDVCSKSTTSIKKLVDKAHMLVGLSAEITTDMLESIPLAVAVESTLADYGDSMAQKQVACQNDIDPTLNVKAVPYQLNELIANLISNAVRYSTQNGVIVITAQEQAATITVSVHDDGTGLDPDNLERIFDEFYKADESRHDLDATGLGLSICKKIILNHQGRIWAESPGIDRGTTILFTLRQTNR